VARPDEVVPAVMPKGSVLIYTSNFHHGSGENRSNGVRRGMALHYNLGWLRQEENQYLSLPPEVAKTFSPEIQRLVGYDFGGPYLGFVEPGHPQALTGQAPADMARTNAFANERATAIKPIPVG
jgi:ectoine hydroxylase-related dioxygenase (phytanoyl-CoA dioxygenase family)